MYYWGFDIGDGESAIARLESGTEAPPQIIPIAGEPLQITAWAVMPNGERRIGEAAERSVSSALRSAVRFKSRFLDSQSDSAGLISDFASKILELLRSDRALVGGENSNCFAIGCPAGWDEEARKRYHELFIAMGCPAPSVISESRAVMVGALQSNAVRDYVDLRTKSVLVIDIGSSTTDFAYVNKGREQEIHTGGEVSLGGGIMDAVLLRECIARSADPAGLTRVFEESSSWRVYCELTARHLKEQYFSGDGEEACETSCLINYDGTQLLDIRMDGEIADILTEKACPELNGRSFHHAFIEGLRTVRESIGAVPPELLFLTGGVSRMPRISAWCREIFPEAILFHDREPEFSVARGLSWCGRVDDEVQLFRQEVDAYIRSDAIETIVAAHLEELYRIAQVVLIDPILMKAVKPVLVDWRKGNIVRLADIEPILRQRIDDYLHSAEATKLLLEPVGTWMERMSAELQRETSLICRKYHLPERSLEIASRVSPGDLSVLGRIGTDEMFSGDGLTGATLLIESIITILVGMICGGSGVVLIAEGPIGIVVGVVASAAVLALTNILGKDALQKQILEADLPLPVRYLALSKPLPRVEMPKFSLSKFTEQLGLPDLTGGIKLPLLTQKEEEGEQLLPADMAEAEDSATDADDEISSGRFRTMRRRIIRHYDELLQDRDNVELRSLNEKMTIEISRQIEALLKDLSEQVEVPM
ncbi:MAG: hypothetical protein IJT34_09665 [Butyrivibrio sp.]|nr:hypothetical protein [Butyrivibrio sp.]